MKNFTKQNFKTNPLWIRLLIMTFMLLAGSSSAWAYNQSAVDLYFDNSEAKWSNCYVYIGHSTWTSCYPMERVSGTQYLWKLASNFNGGNSWDNATGWVVCNEKWWDSKGESIDKYTWHESKNVTKKITAAWSSTTILKTEGTTSVTSDGHTINAYKTTTITKSNYTVKINSATGGTLTVKDYDNNTVSNNASKIYLTVLKFTAAPSTGYSLQEVQINNGSTTTTISAANLGTTYTLKSNVTITPVWEKDCTPPAEPTLTNPDPQCGGSITLPATAEGVNLKWYDAQTGGNVVSDTEITATRTYWAAAVTECESTSRTAYTVTINPIPEVISLLSTLNICIGSIDETDLTTLSHVEVSSGSTAVWYTSKDGVEQAERANLINGGTYWVAAENSTTGCKSTTRTSFTININDLPQRPSLDKDEYETCAHASNTVNLDELAGTNNVVWYIGVTEVDDPGQISLATAGTFIYTAKAKNQEGCQSADGATFTLKVNEAPTISITGNTSAVFYEDVVLTATGTDIDEVNWQITNGTGTLSSTTGTSVKLTSSTAGTVKVKATATSENGCINESDELSVTFAAEVCNNVADMTKIYFDATGNNNFNNNVYLSVAGNTYNKNRSADCNDTSHAGDYWPGEDGTFYKMTKIEGTNIYYVNKPASIPSGKISIWNKNAEGHNNVWEAHVILAKSLENNKNCLTLGSSNHHNDQRADVYCSSWTTYANKPQITLPAAKTTLLDTTEGEGNINFNGLVVKTGCAETLTYGFAYSTDANADKNSWTKVESTNNGNTVGSTFSGSVNELQDGTYYVCAYITNSAGTAFGAVNEITVSNIKYPIKNISLDYCNRGGEIIPDPNPMCKGTTAYIKLNYVGSRYSEYKWLINGVATDRIQNFNNNVWVFNIQGDETVTVELRNDANKDGETPTWATSNKLTFTMVAEPTTPTVSLSPNVICSNNDGATLSIASVAVGQTYVLYKYADENDNEGAEVDGYAALPCIDANVELSFTNLTQAGRYFVKTYNTDNCQSIMSASSFATLEVVDARDVFIGFEPTSATTTPWMPAKFTVNASDKYTLNVTKGNPAEPATEVEVNQNGNKVSVKIPLPEGSTGGDGQYENVTFPQGAKTSYTITANLSTSGGVDNPCAAPAEATITLTPYVEPCTEGH